MPRNEKGFAPIIATFIVLLGIVVATYLTLHTQIFRPSASSDATRVEFIDANGNVISQTASRNVTLRLTYVPSSVSVTQTGGTGNTVTAPGGTVSTSGSSTVTSTGTGDVNVQFSGPTASVGTGSISTSSNNQSFTQTTTTVSQNGQTTTTTTSSGAPIVGSTAGQFPSNFRIANSLTALGAAQTSVFSQNSQQINWLLDSGDGIKTVYVQYEVGGVWQSPVSSSITLATSSTTVSATLPPSSTVSASANFIIQVGAPTTVNSGQSGTTTAAPIPVSSPIGGTIVNGVANGGKITLPNGSVLQGGNGNGTSGVIPPPPAPQTSQSSSTLVPVKLLVESDSDPSNLFSAKLLFDPAKAKVANIDISGSFVTNWVSNTFDNGAGTITIIGGVASPGLKTTGTPVLMATIYLAPVNSSQVSLSLDPSSAIYRNSDNANISNNQTATPPIIVYQPPSGATPAPVTPTNPVATPQPTPQSTPISTQVVFSGGGTTVPGNSSSSTTSTSCVIDQTNWSSTQSSSGSVVTVTATGNSQCNGQTVNFGVSQNNGLLGSTAVPNPPPAATFNGNTATSTWVTASNNGVLGGLFGQSGYSLNASLPQSNRTVTSTTDLKVDKALTQGFKKGDVNHDGSITLEDLSAFLSNLGKRNSVPEMDINNDGVVNVFDVSALISLLRQQRVIP